jgi:hypothetical protein
VQWGKSHGRQECRELWLVDGQEMTSYLGKEYDWPGLGLCGRIRRSRKPIGATEWQEQKTHTWLSSLSAERATAKDIAQALRGHWTVENGIFRVRDVSYDEDRLHGRKIARGLSSFRDVAINIIRQQGYPFVPDGWRDLASHPGLGLDLLRHIRLLL